VLDTVAANLKNLEYLFLECDVKIFLIKCSVCVADMRPIHSEMWSKFSVKVAVPGNSRKCLEYVQ